MKTLEFSTQDKYQLLDITAEVEKIVLELGIEVGICLVFVPHATAAVILEENEEGLKKDFVRFFKEFAEREGWEHDRIDDNASAHLLSGLIGQSRVIPISAGRLALGTWQRIFLVELDGPKRARRVVVLVLKRVERNVTAV